MSRNPKKWANLVFFNNNFSSKIPPNCSINPFVWSDFRECTKNKNPEEVCCRICLLELKIWTYESQTLLQKDDFSPLRLYFAKYNTDMLHYKLFEIINLVQYDLILPYKTYFTTWKIILQIKMYILLSICHSNS